MWATLPPGDIPAIIEPALPPNARILDLGAGAGRLTHPLAAAGHHVTAVDESAEMLSRIHRNETICSTIESLRLDRKFDVVLLASHLVNVPDSTERNGILATRIGSRQTFHRRSTLGAGIRNAPPRRQCFEYRPEPGAAAARSPAQ
ncbi:class I SAM-dependent methyltransferase [Streptomyces sp. STR69]|uniref:class I SAM-dependent methyltransferase n=1 Tax=Streptomyces sp. STR69 TaxID=1796942 RepID=UPI0021C6A35E|nr:class I SAM-dependent methyltransferase [Streptomyces sp. STR69]